MRIVYLLPDPGIPVGGVKGASVHVAEVCRALSQAGAEVLLLAMRAVGDSPPGVELAVFGSGKLPSGAEGELARERAVKDFFAWAGPRIAAFGAGVIYERLSLFAGSGGTLAARLGVPRLVEVNAPVAAERGRHFGLGHVELAESAERAALAGAAVIAISEPVAAWSRSRGAATVLIVPNGVDAERFAPERNAVAGEALRRRLGLEGSELIGFVGSLKPWHGVEVLLEATAQLASRRPLVQLLVVGDGPGRATLEAARGPLAGRCQLTGPVPSTAVPAYLAAVDVATAPYLHPGLAVGFYFSPLKVLEAMAAARPVVASCFPSIKELLGGTGRLVAPASSEGLATSLEELLDHPERARALGAAARARAIRFYSWSAVAAHILTAAKGGSPAGRTAAERPMGAKTSR